MGIIIKSNNKKTRNKKLKMNIFVLMISIQFANGKNLPNSIPSSTECYKMISDEMQVYPENFMRTIEHYPKYFRFEAELRLNSNFGFPAYRVPATPKAGLQNIFHVSSSTNDDSSCSSTQAGRLPSLFAYMDREGEFKYLYMEFCQGKKLNDLYIKPEDFGFSNQNWISFKMEQSEQTGKTTLWLNDILIADLSFDEVFDYQNVHVWAASDLWQKEYNWPVADANIRHLSVCDLSN